jgi:hypothetical protein
MAIDDPNQRNARHSVSLFVGLGHDGKPPGRTRNISLSGLFVETPVRPPVGSSVDVWFVWGEDTFVGQAKVIRHADDGIGVAFLDPDALFLGALAEILGIPALA